MASTLLPDQYRQFFLKNGLEVFLIPASSSGQVHLHCMIKAGMLHEAEHIGSGLAHWLEHCLFLGSKNFRKSNDLSRYIEDLGGFDQNAHTDYDHAAYYFSILKEHSRDGLKAMAQLVTKAKLPRQACLNEKKVILSEMDMDRDEADYDDTRRFYKRIYRNSPMSYPILGERDRFLSLSYKNLTDFYQKHYVAQNACLFVIGDLGDINWQEAIEAEFSTWQEGAHAVLPHFPKASCHSQYELIESEKYKTSRTKWVAAIPSGDHPDALKLDLIDTLLGGARRSLGMRRYVDSDEAVSFDTHAWTPSFPGLFEIQIQCYDAWSEDRARSVLSELRELIVHSSDEDLGSAKKRLITDVLQQWQNPSSMATAMAGSKMVFDRIDCDESYLRDINPIKKSAILEVFDRYLSPDKWEGQGLIPLESGKAKRALPPEEHKISRMGPQQVHITSGSFTLSSIQVLSEAGLAIEKDLPEGSAHLYARMLMEGSGNDEAGAFKDKLEQNGSVLQIQSDFNFLSLSSWFIHEDLPRMLDLLQSLIEKPLLQKERLLSIKNEYLEMLQQDRENPFDGMNQLMREKLFPGELYGKDGRGTEESINQVEQKHLLDYHQRILNRPLFMASAGHDSMKAVPWLERPTAGVVNEENKNNAQPIYGHYHLEKNTLQKAVRIGFRTCGVQSEHALWLDMLSLFLSAMGGPLMALREKTASAYQVYSQQNSFLYDGYFELGFYSGEHSGLTYSMIAERLLSQIDELKKKAPNDKTLKRLKITYLSQKLSQSQQPQESCYTYALSLVGKIPAEHLFFEQVLRPMDLDGIRQKLSEVIRLYFQRERAVIISAGV